MAVSSVSSSVNVSQPQAPQTPDKTDAGKSSSDAPAQTASTPAPTVLTQGTGGAHHHKKKVHHPLPGQPGHQVNKTA